MLVLWFGVMLVEYIVLIGVFIGRFLVNGLLFLVVW